MSMAMQYAVKKRMAKGGMTGPDAEKAGSDEPMPPNAKYAGGGECMACKGGTCMAHGGDVVDRIIQRMAEGGMIANDGETNRADEEPAQFDDLALRDDLESTYNGENSGDMDGAPKTDMDNDDDIVERVMKKIRQTMPRTGQPGYPE